MNDDVNFDELLDNTIDDGGFQLPNGPAFIPEPITMSDLEVNEDPHTEPPTEPPTDPDSTEKGGDDTIVDYSGNPLYLFLQERGIKDPGKLSITNEDDTVEEVDFKTLSPEEQLEIIRQVSDPGLSESEVNTINYLRKNNVTLEQVVDYFANKRLQDYLNENPDAVHKKTYEIDDYSDDDLFLVDLKQRYPDFTEEELLAELNAAKENEELFAKKTEILRNTYKANEDQAEAERLQQEQQQVEDLKNNLMEAAGRFNEIQLDYTDPESDSLVIDDSDKQQMMSYILDQDSEGKSQLVKDLEDPDRLMELAWFGTQGPKLLSELTQYWKNLLAEERATNKKLQSKIDKLSGTSTTTTVKPPKNNTKNTFSSVWDGSDLL